MGLLNKEGSMIADKLYDIAVIGDSKIGRQVAKSLARKSKGKLAIAFISSAFKSDTTIANVDAYENELLQICYRRGVIDLYLTKNLEICCLKAVLAVGSSFAGLDVPKKQISVSRYEQTSKIIIGSGKVAVDEALKTANAGTDTYLVYESFLETSDSVSAAKKKRLYSTKNLHILQNSSAEYELVSADGATIGIETESERLIGEVVCRSKKIPDTSCIKDEIAPKDAVGRIIVDETLRTSKIKSLYAIGSCSTKPEISDAAAISASILL